MARLRGECRHTTPWAAQSEGAAAMVWHYAQQHPGVPWRIRPVPRNVRRLTSVRGGSRAVNEGVDLRLLPQVAITCGASVLGG